ncbi:MAG: fibronectin type III domain-containing protein [Planctomycetota bacterium]
MRVFWAFFQRRGFQPHQVLMSDVEGGIRPDQPPARPTKCPMALASVLFDTDRPPLSRVCGQVSLFLAGACTTSESRSNMECFEHPSRLAVRAARPRRRSGFTLPELLVTMTIIVMLASLAAAAVSQASGSKKKLRTRSLIAKINAIVSSQYESYAGRNVAAITKSQFLQAAAGDRRVDLKWEQAHLNPGGNLVEYRVEWSNNGGLTWPNIAQVPGRSHSVTQLTNGVKYTFRVTTLINGRVGESATVAAIPLSRGELLRKMARADLPDDWAVVQELADLYAVETGTGVLSGDSQLTSRQRAYVAIWSAIPAQARPSIAAEHSAAECLFLAVMHGGLSNCLDCDALRIDVGDQDSDGMPEFLDDWGNPIGFILQPKNLQLPPGSRTNFFSPALPFDPVTATALDSAGGLVRPLIVSAGSDGAFGLMTDGGPVAGSTESFDNLTNFDEEARR